MNAGNNAQGAGQAGTRAVPDQQVAAEEVGQAGLVEPAACPEGAFFDQAACNTNALSEDAEKRLSPEAILEANRIKYEAVSDYIKTEPSLFMGWHNGAYIVIRRHPKHSHLCGYVGIEPDHPLFGKSYSDAVVAPVKLLHRRIDRNRIGFGLLIGMVFGRDEAKIDAGLWDVGDLFDVHGGLTWAEDHPALDDADQKKVPPGLWWFGFDCAHADDYCPGLQNTLLTICSDLESKYLNRDTYRTFDYVMREARDLADQLARYVTYRRWNWLWKLYYSPTARRRLLLVALVATTAALPFIFGAR